MPSCSWMTGVHRFNPLDISSMWREIFKLSRGYRDIAHRHGGTKVYAFRWPHPGDYPQTLIELGIRYTQPSQIFCMGP